MSTLIAILFLGVLLALLLTPLIFIGSCAAMVVSEGQRARVGRHKVLYSLWGVASFLIVYETVSSLPPQHWYPDALDPMVNVPVTSDSIAQADAIVEGSFELGFFPSHSTEALSTSGRPAVEVNTYILPFIVDAMAKGDPAKTLQVLIFFPTYSPSAVSWGLPLKEKLLLFLKKDPDKPGTFELLAQQTSWLVIAHPHAPDATPSDPVKFVMDDVKGFLTAYPNGPTPGFAYYTELGTLGFPPLSSEMIQPDPSLMHALQIGKSVGGADSEFLALAQKLENHPFNQVGMLARSIRSSSGDYSVLMARLQDFNNHPAPPVTDPNGFRPIGDPRSNFPWELENAIHDSDPLDPIMPLITAGLTSPDPKIRLAVCRALRERQYQGSPHFAHGNLLGNQFYPLFVNLLDDPDQDVQYAAMACIYEMSGESRHRPQNREINLWATTIWKQNPDFYLAQYKAWWEKHKTTLDPALNGSATPGSESH